MDDHGVDDPRVITLTALTERGDAARDADLQVRIDAVSLEDVALLIYTSGTTGQPKGALHVHGSLPQQALTTRWALDVRDDDVYWCTADPGWVTGVSYGIIGPWSLGVTQLVLECGFIEIGRAPCREGV